MVSIPISRREYSVYDGQTRIGHFIVDEKTGTAKAFNAAGRSLGKFPGYHAARKAVSEAYRDAATEEAQRRLVKSLPIVTPFRVQ